MKQVRGLRKAAVGLTIAVAIGVVAPALASAPAGAAGITTHAWMATEAVEKVTIPELADLLRANIGQVYAGAQFPDSGYIPGNTYGEEAHWQRFFDSYAQIIMSKPDCGPLTDPTGPCAGEIAHLMGAIAHGMGDEVWDWLFEPRSPDLDEYYLPPAFNGVADAGGQELQMDLVAIALHGRVNPIAPPIPSKPDVLAALDAAGFHGATIAQLDFGQTIQRVIHQAEEAWAPQHIAALRAAMPYLSANLVTEPGGVDFAARAIAAEWEVMWGRLQGSQPPTSVSVTYPADGARRIPAGGWVRDFSPGSSPGRGGARARITAVLTYSMPYVPATGGPGVPSLLPTGAMALTERDTGLPVAIKAGYPRIVPYNPDSGEHLVDIQPADDLTPCTWYRAAVTDKLLDANHEPVAPMSWTFRTGAPDAGGRCADDPYTAEENWVRATHRDLLGRLPTDAELEAATYRLDRDLDRVPATTDLVGSTEFRRRLVDQTYLAYLGRTPDVATRDAWAERLTTESVTSLRAEVLGSRDFYVRSGRSNVGFVSTVYLKALGRPADLLGLFYWTYQLNRGAITRPALAHRLLTSSDGVRHTIRLTYANLLDRRPTAGEVDAWADAVVASDERILIADLLPGQPYFDHAQP